MHVDGGLYWRGSQHQIIYSASTQAKRGHDVQIVCPKDSPLDQHAHELGLRTINVRIHNSTDLPALVRLARIFHTIKPDVVHLQDAHSHAVAGPAAKLAGVPAVILSRRLDNPINGLALRWQYRHFYDAVISVSDGVKQVLEDAGVMPERIRTIHSAVHDDLWQRTGDGERIKREFGFGPNNKIVLALAHIERRKGIETLLDAMPMVASIIPGARALVVGGGSHRPQVEHKAREMSLIGTVIFTGFRNDIADLLAAADVVASPSYLEGCCNAVMEGMAAGKPVVGTNVGGTPEIIRHGVNGLLIPPRDAESLASALINILTHPETAEQFGKAGRQIIREHFSVDRLADETLDVYYQVLLHTT